MASHILRLQSLVKVYRWRGHQGTLGEHNEGDSLVCPEIWEDMEVQGVGWSTELGSIGLIYCDTI